MARKEVKEVFLFMVKIRPAESWQHLAIVRSKTCPSLERGASRVVG